MRLSYVLTSVMILSTTLISCGDKKKRGKVSASLMRSQIVSAALTESSGNYLTATGSMVQSFTPTSLKIPIFRVAMCKGNSSCAALYSCAANTVEGCGVELSKIDVCQRDQFRFR